MLGATYFGLGHAWLLTTAQSDTRLSELARIVALATALQYHRVCRAQQLDAHYELVQGGLHKLSESQQPVGAL